MIGVLPPPTEVIVDEHGGDHVRLRVGLKY
jgi:hypothetical protein